MRRRSDLNAATGVLVMAPVISCGMWVGMGLLLAYVFRA